MNDELAKALVFWEDHEDIDHFEEVISEKITDSGRWTIDLESIWKDKRDNTFWKLMWERGATEYQEADDEVYFEEVVPKEVTITEYVKK